MLSLIICGSFTWLKEAIRRKKKKKTEIHFLILIFIWLYLYTIVVCAKAVNDTTTPANNVNADLNFLFMSRFNFI